VETIRTFSLHENLLGPLAGLADDDDAVAKYRTLNTNDKAQVTEVIRELILPNYRSLNHDEQVSLKLCLRYYLSKPDSRLDRVFNSILPPFDPPTNARDFFLWTWEVLFPGEEFKLENWQEYDVDNRPFYRSG